MRFWSILAALLLAASPAFAQVSPDGTTITAPTGTVVTTAGTWSWGPQAAPWGYNIFLNGGPQVQGDANTMEVANGGQLYALTPQGAWYIWNGTAFVSSGPPPMAVSPDGTTVTAPSATTLTTTDGTWNFGAANPPWGYNIFLNGGSSFVGVASLMEVAGGGHMYAEDANSNWYIWQAGSFVSSTAPPPPAPTVGPRGPVGPQASITCTGTAIAAGASIQTAVNAAAARTTFCLGVGTFSNQSVTPKSGDIFIGKVGTILDGGGTTVRAFASTSSNPNVLIENMIVQNYTGGSQVVAIDGQNATGWTIVHNEVRMNDGDGIAVAGAGLIQYNYCHHNLELCYGSNPGTGIQILDNEISFNNYTNKYNCGNQCGGGKLWSTTGAVVSYNYTHDNNGPGFWDDYDNQSITYSSNRIENNWTGIQHEIGYSASIHDNTFLNNGKSAATNPSCTWLWCSAIGIYASGGATTAAPSGQVEIFNNTIVSAAPGNVIGLVQQNRQGVTGQEPCCGPWLVTNLWVHDNTIDMTAGGGVGGVTDFTGGSAMFGTAANNKFDRNHYTLGTNNADFWWNGSTGGKAFWQAAGQDPNGTFQ